MAVIDVAMTYVPVVKVVKVRSARKKTIVQMRRRKRTKTCC
jgi:hypothetical protein